MTEAVLVLNSGSSSIKFAVYPAQDEAPPVCAGKITGIGRSPEIWARGGAPVAEFGRLAPDEPHAVLIERLVDWLGKGLRDNRLVAAGHRVVHGGREYAAPVLVDDIVMEKLGALTALAPQHQPHNLAGMRALAAARPGLPQVACFDTAFHRTQPRLAQLFAIPRALSDDGIIRYGFHGLSYQYIAGQLPHHAGRRAEGRIIVAHLGHGASLCALRKRKSVATSMGFTALDGLMMGRRPGALDPGVVLHLLRDRGMSLDEVSDLLNLRSGLLGVSELSDDMRDLFASDDPRAREAVDLFAYRAISEIGALAAVLGGIDGLVFTAGIGEKAGAVRKRIAAGLGWLGLRLDDDANDANAIRISAPGSAIAAFVIPTDEESVIASDTRRLWKGLSSDGT
ncbi:acetate/propionate family kinase [Oceanibacterium hippocampi]|uniref:Acetate kinase n=1 Tax=Oceanibacterium hippocampi TaxID=745714 RepID=A0A1Y5TKF5_9PROT|nr:acetate/propionate family kinase [Oceanibacterium hippocampi]SLN66176.1 Acetate kinase [Oceanibacterium hippocampi]